MNKPEALYIHIPFCEHICDYCDFTKLQYFRNFALSYLSHLKKELSFRHVVAPIKTIYIGGGTPTALEDDLFEEMLKIIEPFTLSVSEYTCECNPESLSKNKLLLMKKYHVNRLSIGVESTDDRVLSSINRHHTYKDVVEAYNLAREVGFNNINIDLIIGLPHVNKKQFEKDLHKIIELNPEHISCYSLTVHEHTRFFLNNIKEPTDELSRQCYDLADSLLKDKGYIHYEISNWAKPSFFSKHNYVYWKNERYYGIGLGAAGYIDNYRYTNTRSINEYCSDRYEMNREILSLDDEMTYQIMLNLRTIEGLDCKMIYDRYGYDILNNKKDILLSYKEHNLIKIEQQKIIPTFDGMMVLDQLILDLIK